MTHFLTMSQMEEITFGRESSRSPRRPRTSDRKTDFCEEAILEAAKSGHVASLDGYIQNGLDVNYVFCHSTDTSSVHGKTLLHIAVQEQHSGLAQYLLKSGCDVNKGVKITGRDGPRTKIRTIRYNDRLEKTCLYMAICMQKADLCEMLVQGDADVNLYDGTLCTATWHAVDTNNVDIAKAILNAPNCKINMGDRFQMTPLHVSVMHCNLTLASMILDNVEALVDPRQLQGASPLYMAASFGNADMVRLLLGHGASANLPDSDGTSPLSVALSVVPRPDDLTVALLINAGAKVTSCSVGSPLPTLDRDDLFDFVHAHIDVPRTLKILVATEIRNKMKLLQDGRSIFCSINQLPLPDVLKGFLTLNI